VRHAHTGVRHRRHHNKERGEIPKAEAFVTLLIVTPYTGVLTVVFGAIGVLALIICPLASPFFFVPAAFFGLVTISGVTAAIRHTIEQIAQCVVRLRQRQKLREA
jgi:hypothetical protein